MNYIPGITHLLRKIGLDVYRYDPAWVMVKYKDTGIGRLMALLRHEKIDLILDVGANIGQYAISLRASGYQGRIVSFEPLSSAFSRLKQQAQNHPPWDVVNIALGKEDTNKAEIHVAGNSVSSSLLNMFPRHVEVLPDSTYTGSEKVVVRTLDGVFNEYYCYGDRPFLKIDAQGYEMNILEGANQSLDRIIGFSIEMSLVPLYDGEASFKELISFLSSRGYVLMSVEPGFSDPISGQVLQVDGIFFRPNFRSQDE